LHVARAVHFPRFVRDHSSIWLLLLGAAIYTVNLVNVEAIQLRFLQKREIFGFGMGAALLCM
jgi:hypothetical protein